MTAVLVALIATIPATAALIVAVLNRRSLRTESGMSIGVAAERSMALSAADVLMSRYVLAHASGDGELAERLLKESLEHHHLTPKEANGDG